MSKLTDTLRTLDGLKSRGFIHYTPLKLNGRITHTSYSPKDNDITIIFVSGFGVNDKKDTITFLLEELDEQLLLFIEPIRGKTKYADDYINKKEIKQDKKPKNFLAMAEDTENNFTTMRKHLFTAMRKLEAGDIKPEDAKAMAVLSQSITNSAKVEMEFRKMAGKPQNPKLIE